MASTSAERASDRRPALRPKTGSFLDQSSFRAVTRDQLRLALGDFVELVFQSFGDASVQRTSALAQERAVGRILHQAMLEQIGRVRRLTLPKEQTCSLLDGQAPIGVPPPPYAPPVANRA